MFSSSAAFAFFDYFRVPYQVAQTSHQAVPDLPTASLGCTGASEAARLHWLPAVKAPGQWHLLDGAIPIFGAVAADEAIGEPLRRAGFQPLLPLVPADGGSGASVWRHPDGSVLLPFDPGEVMANFWSERHRTVGSRGAVATAMGLARRGYYRLRPLLPRALQIRLRQRFSGVQQRSAFPHWPVESALHDLYALLFDLVAGIAEAQVPHISLWPHGHRWALVLTHDVETAVGYERLHLLRDLESSFGLRSSWNFVPRRYDTDDRVVRDLQDAGFEVGVHGLYHDGRDFGSLRTFRQRLTATHAHARRWGAVGYRSPALHRVWEWMPELQFDYDSSYPDTDPYQPIPGGCCSVLPYHNGPLVELPITLAQDFVMFDLLQRSDEALWLEKLAYVRDTGGMALVLTHPDYMLDPSRQDAYRRFLAAVHTDGTGWHALPSQVATWWRRRTASQVQRVDGRWEVAGPAADEAHVTFAGNPARIRAGTL